MRLNPAATFATLALMAGIAAAIAQSPNFSSLTTEVKVMTSDSLHPYRVTVPLPYREPQRRLLAPVPANKFDETWPLSEPDIGKRTDQPREGS